jgi:hypothetical protein
MSPFPAVVSAVAGRTSTSTMPSLRRTRTGGTYPHHRMRQRWGISSLVFEAQGIEAIKAAHAALPPFSLKLREKQ